MRMDWKDKVILISGGTSGIGLATARILLEKGAGVVINGRDVAKGRAALSHLQSLPGSCQFVPGDVSDERALPYRSGDTASFWQAGRAGNIGRVL